MPTRFLILCAILLCDTCVYSAFWDAWKPEINAIKVETAKNAEQLVKANVAIGENAKSLADVKAQVGDISARIDSKVDTKIAAYDKSVKTDATAGRDVHQNSGNTNDSALMKEMVLAYKAIICLLVVQMCGLVIQMIVLVKYIAKLFQAQIIEKDKMVDRERQSRDDKDQKADEWKERFIESVSGHKTEGVKP